MEMINLHHVSYEIDFVVVKSLLTQKIKGYLINAFCLFGSALQMNPLASAFPTASCGVSERAISDNSFSLRIEGFPDDLQRGAFNYFIVQ
jgi:hypothetical protein